MQTTQTNCSKKQKIERPAMKSATGPSSFPTLGLVAASVVPSPNLGSASAATTNSVDSRAIAASLPSSSAHLTTSAAAYAAHPPIVGFYPGGAGLGQPLAVAVSSHQPLTGALIPTHVLPAPAVVVDNSNINLKRKTPSPSVKSSAPKLSSTAASAFTPVTASPTASDDEEEVEGEDDEKSTSAKNGKNRKSRGKKWSAREIYEIHQCYKKHKDIRYKSQKECGTAVLDDLHAQGKLLDRKNGESVYKLISKTHLMWMNALDGENMIQKPVKPKSGGREGEEAYQEQMELYKAAVAKVWEQALGPTRIQSKSILDDLYSPRDSSGPVQKAETAIGEKTEAGTNGAEDVKKPKAKRKTVLERVLESAEKRDQEDSKVMARLLEVLEGKQNIPKAWRKIIEENDAQPDLPKLLRQMNFQEASVNHLLQVCGSIGIDTALDLSMCSEAESLKRLSDGLSDIDKKRLERAVKCLSQYYNGQ